MNYLESLDVNGFVKSGKMENSECILRGTCMDNCTNKAIVYSFIRGEYDSTTIK